MDRMHIVAEHRDAGASLHHLFAGHVRLAFAGAAVVEAVQLLAAHAHDDRPGEVLMGRCRRALADALDIERQRAVVALGQAVVERAALAVGSGKVLGREQVLLGRQLQQPLLDAGDAGPVDAAVLSTMRIDLGNVVHRIGNRCRPLLQDLRCAHGTPPPGSASVRIVGTAVRSLGHLWQRLPVQPQFQQTARPLHQSRQRTQKAAGTAAAGCTGRRPRPVRTGFRTG